MGQQSNAKISRAARWFAALATCATMTVAGEAFSQLSNKPMDAAHNPPLLVLQGEAVGLRFDVICPGVPCADLKGGLYVRSNGTTSFHRLELDHHLRHGNLLTRILRDDAFSGGGFMYYAVFEDNNHGLATTLPTGGADAPQQVWVLDPEIVRTVVLTNHNFGATSSPADVVAEAAWGSAGDQLGLDRRPEQADIGPSSFDVNQDGSVVVLDQVNRRAVTFARGRAPAVTPLVISGAQADIALGSGGALYVVEGLGGRPGKPPKLHVFGPKGDTAVALQPLAERTADQIRITPKGPMVHQYPSDTWMSMTHAGLVDPAAELLPAQAQAARGRASRPSFVGPRLKTKSGGSGVLGLVVKATPVEIRAALVDGDKAIHAWRVVNQTSALFGEVQLAEMMNDELVVVVRVWSEDFDLEAGVERRQAEFRVLRLGLDSMSQDFAVDTGEWAETAPVSRFRLGPHSLYQLKSTPWGVQVVRYWIGR